MALLFVFFSIISGFSELKNFLIWTHFAQKFGKSWYWLQGVPNLRFSWLHFLRFLNHLTIGLGWYSNFIVKRGNSLGKQSVGPFSGCTLISGTIVKEEESGKNQACSMRLLLTVSAIQINIKVWPENGQTPSRTPPIPQQSLNISHARLSTDPRNKTCITHSVVTFRQHQALPGWFLPIHNSSD